MEQLAKHTDRRLHTDRQTFLAFIDVIDDNSSCLEIGIILEKSKGSFLSISFFLSPFVCLFFSNAVLSILW